MSTAIELPHNGWNPRPKQMDAWMYLQGGGLHAELIWHRRYGKDEVSLHYTACAAMKRTATYWHMLPLANQARKAIWNAVNPHTGVRRIDEAFPPALRANTQEHEMFIRFKNGSTWQVLGSDNYEGSIGSPPAGIVYSEWAQANPSVRGLLRPILVENGGWQIFITTPRGKNHAYLTYNAAKKNPKAFAQVLTIEDTGLLSQAQLAEELQEYTTTYGEDLGTALYEQEWFCSFDAAIMGAYYAAEMAKIDKECRICEVAHDPNAPVYTGWDLGFDDDTAIWWYQVIRGEIHILEYYYNSGQNIDHYASQLLGVEVSIDIIDNEVVVSYGDPIDGLAHRRDYDYAGIHLPHDARAKTLAARGKSIQEQLYRVFGAKVQIIPTLSLEDGIQAVRKMMPRTYIDESCEEGIEAVRQYRREWDDDKKCFRDKPVHDWTSHPADALRTVAVGWRDTVVKAVKESKITTMKDVTFNDLMDLHKRKIRQ